MYVIQVPMCHDTSYMYHEKLLLNFCNELVWQNLCMDAKKNLHSVLTIFCKLLKLINFRISLKLLFLFNKITVNAIVLLRK